MAFTQSVALPVHELVKGFWFHDVVDRGLDVIVGKHETVDKVLTGFLGAFAFSGIAVAWVRVQKKWKASEVAQAELVQAQQQRLQELREQQERFSAQLSDEQRQEQVTSSSRCRRNCNDWR